MKRFLCLLLLLALCCPAAWADTGVYYYQLGDMPTDFTLTTADGETVSLSGLLAKYRAVLLNFWFAGCAPCRYEFPYLQNAYEQLGDQVAVLAITPYDDNETILRYQEALGLTLPMAHDTAGVTEHYALYGFPTNVLIDRNGVVCYTKAGAQPSTDAFLRLMTPFIAEEYAGPLLLASIPAPEMPPAPDESDLNAALNAAGSALAFTLDEQGWPWLVDEAGYLRPGNTGSNASYAAVETVIDAQPGDALRFSYFTSTEEGGDLLAVLVDDTLAKAFSGENPWQTYALALPEGTHTVAFLYSKNDLGAAGQDTVGLREVALVSGAEAAQALAENPAYPRTLPGLQGDVTFLGAEARQIVFDDPDGVLDAYYGADGYFILSGEPRQALVRLGEDCDPDAAYCRTLDTSPRILSHCGHDQEGYSISLPAPDPDLGWDALLLFPTLLDTSSQYARVYLYFDSPEAVDAFCLTQVVDPYTGEAVDNVTWRYL